MALCNDTIKRFEQVLGMPFDKKKAQLTTTSKEAAQIIAKALGERVGDITSDTVKLGIDSTLTPKMRKVWGKTRAKRWVGIKRRVKKPENPAKSWSPAVGARIRYRECCGSNVRGRSDRYAKNHADVNESHETQA